MTLSRSTPALTRRGLSVSWAIFKSLILCPYAAGPKADKLLENEKPLYRPVVRMG